jgi:hypothetical protein
MTLHSTAERALHSVMIGDVIGTQDRPQIRIPEVVARGAGPSRESH